MIQCWYLFAFLCSFAERSITGKVLEGLERQNFTQPSELTVPAHKRWVCLNQMPIG